MTFRATKKEISGKTELRGHLDFLNLSNANYTLRFIDMQIFHVHRVNRGKNIRRALDDALSSLRQDYWSTRR